LRYLRKRRRFLKRKKIKHRIFLSKVKTTKWLSKVKKRKIWKKKMRFYYLSYRRFKRKKRYYGIHRQKSFRLFKKKVKKRFLQRLFFFKQKSLNKPKFWKA